VRDPLENLLPNFPSANVLPVIEKRVRHGARFNIVVSQIQPGRAENPPGSTMELDAGEPRPPRLRVFDHQKKLIAIAEQSFRAPISLLSCLNPCLDLSCAGRATLTLRGFGTGCGDVSGCC